MRQAAVLACLLGVLAAGGAAQAGDTPPGCCPAGRCFPPSCCPDDYGPNPFPRQCWPPYPPFYVCVPAGDPAQPGACDRGRGRLTLWFLPTPRALREALWLDAPDTNPHAGCPAPRGVETGRR